MTNICKYGTIVLRKGDFYVKQPNEKIYKEEQEIPVLVAVDEAYTENEDVKVIEVALKYGYDSPDSFARAFVKFSTDNDTLAAYEAEFIEKGYKQLSPNFTFEDFLRKNKIKEDEIVSTLLNEIDKM